MAGKALVVVGFFDREAFCLGAVFFFFAAGIGRALNALAAAVVEGFDAALPCGPVEHVEVPFIDIAGEEDVDGLGLADVFGAVSGEFDHPALIKFKRRFEDVFFVLGQFINMLNRSAVLEDTGPGVVVVEALFVQ